MNFEVKKTENWFADSQTYEYRLPMTGQKFLSLLDAAWQPRCNLKLRRPVFLAERGGIRIKGILAADVIRVSFPDQDWKNLKLQFEQELDNYHV